MQKHFKPFSVGPAATSTGGGNARLLGCTLRLGVVVHNMIWGAYYGANEKCSSVAESATFQTFDWAVGLPSLVHTSTYISGRSPPGGFFVIAPAEGCPSHGELTGLSDNVTCGPNLLIYTLIPCDPYLLFITRTIH
jgi:hypothetical protein